MEHHRKDLDDFFQNDSNLLRLHNSALHMIRSTRGFIDESYADDLVQETLLAAWSHIDQYEGMAKITTWMFQIMRNVFINHIRIQSKIKKIEIAFLKILKASSPSKEMEVPLEAIEQEEVSKGISEALEKLPPDQKKVYLLLMEDKTYEEIGREMGKSQTQIRGVLYRARSDMKNALTFKGFVTKRKDGAYRRAG